MGPWIVLAGLACVGPQSALEPAGRDAVDIARMFWWMTGGGLLAWVLVLGIGARALGSAPANPDRAVLWVVGGGGVALPTVLLTIILVAGLPMLPRVLDPGPEQPVRISVSGEQWWWRVRYDTPQGTFDLANEVHLPVGKRTALVLTSPDVIHSLWFPSLAGKMDMVPGRTTTLPLEPVRTGAFRGACAEYCGQAHTQMALWAVVHEADAFSAWLEHELLPARRPTDPLTRRGATVFLQAGCGACHTVRGTPANGNVGPDLTHVGSRTTLAAGILPNDAATFRRWLVETDHLKPGVRMPQFDMLPEPDLDALAAYTESLQ